jgi:hypothetical protein
MKHLFKLLASILSVARAGLRYFCDAGCSKGVVNKMWILKNSQDLLTYIQSRSLLFCNSIGTFDIYALYTTILHTELKDRLKE